MRLPSGDLGYSKTSPGNRPPATGDLSIPSPGRGAEPTAAEPDSRVAGTEILRKNSVMASGSRLTYTDVELKSYLPSGWGIRRDAVGRWDAAEGVWRIDVYDPAENDWPLVVPGKDATAKGRLEALRASVDELYREALG
jgi:hypothetical protein